jgi:DNA polymerase-1
MSERILLVDGMYLVFSSFYSHHAMRTLQGEPTGAVYGFISRMESLIQELRPDRLVVAFDSKEPNFRRELYPAYKAKRLLPPEELLQQLPDIRAYIAGRGIHFLEKPGLEGDDIIALLSRRFAAAGAEVLIFSADKDLFQLVDDRVAIFHPKLKRKLDREEVKKFFGVFPEQIVDYLVLAGDASDNIPGIPGIGDKTATRLLEKFGSLESMLKNLDQVEGKLRDKIVANHGLFDQWRRLLDFARIPDVSIDLQVPRFQARSGESLLDLYRRLQFGSLLKKMGGALGGGEPAEVPRVVLVDDLPKLEKLAAGIRKAGRFAWDVETTALEFSKAEIVGLAITVSGQSHYVPFLVPAAEANRPHLDFAAFQSAMADIFLDQKIGKTGHNLKFDMLHLRRHGMPVRGIEHDTMIMSYLLFPNRRSHQLKELSAEFLGIRQTTYEELVGRGKNQMPLAEVEVERLAGYCAADASCSWQLLEKLEPQLRARKLQRLYRDIEIPLVQVLQEMEWHGIAVDRAFLQEADDGLRRQIAAGERQIQEMAGYAFNLNSSQQLAELLFEKMNLPLSKKTRKTKAQSTDIEVLNELKGYPIVERIIAYRTFKKLHSTYVLGLLDTLDEQGRVHTQFNQTVTATGRLSSSNPNLQNIPVGTFSAAGSGAGLNLRRAFVAAPGHKLLSADYSQIELRVMAHFSGDKNLRQAFAEGADIHQRTAELVFGADLFSQRHELRRRAKIINFSIIYGTGAYSLAKELGVGFAEAKEFIERYFEKYSGVRKFMDRVIADAEKDPEVRTLSGRVRPIPEIQSSNRTVKENGNRMAINTIIQGSAADIIKMAMIRIHGHLGSMQSRLVLQVHDELVFEYPEGEEKKLIALVRKEMESALELEVPLKVSLKKGANWADMDEIAERP